MDSTMGVHDSIVDLVADRIKDQYDEIKTFVVYKNSPWGDGEIDLLARKGNTYNIYEIKCHYNHKSFNHAKEQLKRDEQFVKWYFKAKKINKIYVAENYVKRV
jgi:Holliday junction resolvase-like predicted endonuclease